MTVQLVCDRCDKTLFGSVGSAQLAFDVSIETWPVRRHPNDALAMQRDSGMQKKTLHLCGSCSSSLREWAKPLDEAAPA